MLECVLFKNHDYADTSLEEIKFYLYNARQAPVQEHDSMKLVTKERKIFQCFEASLKKSLEKVQNKAKELGEMLAQTETRLNKTLFSLENIKGELPKWHDELVYTSNKYFKLDKKYVYLLYPHLDLIKLDLLKVITHEKQMDEEDESPIYMVIPTQGAEASSEKNEGSCSRRRVS